MNPDLKKLLDIQRFDKEVADFELELRRIQMKEDKIIEVVEAKKLHISEAEDAIEELKEDMEFKKSLLDETIENLRKLEIKLNNVSNEKQLQAVNTEIDIAMTNKTVLKEKLKSLEDELAKKEKEIKELQEKFDQLIRTLEEYQNKFNERRQQIKQKIREVNKAKEELLPTIDKKIFKKYEKINKWAKGNAIVPVRQDACYGCFMKLTPQVLTLLEETDEIVYCPNCGRMLYVEQENNKEKVQA